MNLTTVLALTITLAEPPRAAVLCSTTELRESPGYRYRPERIAGIADSAEVIVRAIAIAEDSVTRRNSPDGSSYRMPIIRFRITETLRGGLDGPLEFYGRLTQAADDFNPYPVPYTTVRPNGQHGNCFATEYRRGAEYLLLLRRDQHGLTPYWVPLAPVNEQIRGDDDPWLAWIRGRIAR
jgi:hypothetical protein